MIRWIAILSFVMIALSFQASDVHAGCVTGVSPGKSLNIRSGPSTRFSAVGTIPSEACGVAVTRQCRHNWCRAAYAGVTGWVSMKFIDRDAVASPVVPAAAGPAPLASNDWEFLGERNINYNIDLDTIPIGPREGRYTALQLYVEKADIAARSLRITFRNGNVQNIPIRALIRAGSYSQVFDLRGNRRFLKQVQLSYESKPGETITPEVQLFALSATPVAAPPPVAARVPPAAPPPPARPAPALTWQLIEVRTVTFRPDRDIVRIGPAAGKFRALQFVVTRNDLLIDDIKVVYGNGAIDDIKIRRKIRAGKRTRILDLRGPARFIREIRFIYRTEPPLEQTARIAIYGLRALP